MTKEGRSLITAKNKSPAKVASHELLSKAKHCGVLIVAAGFEDRARPVLDTLKESVISRVVLVRYPEGIKENDDTFAIMHQWAVAGSSARMVPVVVLDLRHPDDYLIQLRLTLSQWLPDSDGEVWIDVSAMPMQGICATLGAVRGALPGRVVQILYTEAAEYHPTKEEVEQGDTGVAALSKEMAGNLIPKQFAGASSAASTCLFVFAGYEKHRSLGVVDELNPSRLVVIYGKPPGRQRKWRLQWSKKLHEHLHQSRQCASEIVSTLNPLDALSVLNSYYGYLFADHNIAVAPICSKMQCVACYLFWERYRDVQLVFPLPVAYLPKKFSEKYLHTYRYTLPSTAELGLIAESPF